MEMFLLPCFTAFSLLLFVFCARPFEELEEDEEIGFLQIHVCHCSSVFYHL